MMQKLRAGIVGLGAISRKHIYVLNNDPNVDIVAVADHDEERLQQVDLSRVSRFRDFRKMIAETELDIVVILTPSGTHASIAMECSGRVANLVIEKPLALDLKEADELIHRCDATGTRIFVVKQNRFNRPVMALKRALEEGRFGKLVMGTVRVRWCRDEKYYNSAPWRGTWAMDGGVLTNQAAHHIDLLEWMMGDPVSVKAYMDTRLAPIECEDTAAAILRFENGSLGIIEATTCTRPRDIEGSISVLGEKGSVVIGGFAANELQVWNFSETVPDDSRIFEEWGRNPDEFAWNHAGFYRDVFSSIRENRKALIDGLEARRSLELINAVYESAESGKEVFLKFQPRFSRLGKK